MLLFGYNSIVGIDDDADADCSAVEGIAIWESNNYSSLSFLLSTS